VHPVRRRHRLHESRRALNLQLRGSRACRCG
jgi:hypothetical protein